MWKKILTIMMALAMITVAGAVMPVKGGLVAESPQGSQVDSYDGAASLTDDGSTLNGNITLVHPADENGVDWANVSITDDISGSMSDYSGTHGLDLYSWDAGGTDSMSWRDSPNDASPDQRGQLVYFLNEQVSGSSTYISVVSRAITQDTNLPSTQQENTARYEPIPIPGERNGATGFYEPGPDYINFTIEEFMYTDCDDTSSSRGQGTFDYFEDYSVFIQGGSYGSWTFLDFSKDLSASAAGMTYDSPVVPYDWSSTSADTTDPDAVTTGLHYFNTSDAAVTLDPETTYTFIVRANFNVGGAYGGYQGGMHSYTFYGSSDPTATAADMTTGSAPEFPTILVPVMATMGLFIAAIYYRRTKE